MKNGGHVSRYGAFFGLDSDNQFKVGGWSMGSVAYPILHSGNYTTYALPASNPTVTGTLTFAAANPVLSSSSFIQMPGGLYVSGGTAYIQGQLNARGGLGNDTGVLAINTATTFSSTATSSANFISTSTNGTGQFAAVSGSTVASFYNDGSNLYLLKNSGGTTGYDSGRPLYVNLSTSAVTIDAGGAGTTFGGNINVGGQSIYSGAGNLYFDYGVGNAKSYIASDGHHFTDWMRIDGSTGLYWQTYGGGWYMLDSTYMRAYGNKTIYTAGNVEGDGGGYFGSDRRWKTEITDLSDAESLSKVLALSGKRYLKKGVEEVGFIAQDVMEIEPTLVKTGASDDYLYLKYDNISAFMPGAIRALEARIAELERRA